MRGVTPRLAQQLDQRHGVPADRRRVHRASSRPASTMPGTPMPMPITCAGSTGPGAAPSASSARAVGAASTASMPATTSATTASGVGRIDRSGRTTEARRRHRQVEQLDGHAGLADVDADHVAVGRVDAQQHPRPAAVRLDLAGLDDEPILDQLGGHGADRGAAQAGQLAELEPAQRTVEEQLRQQRRPVLATDVARRRASRVHGACGSCLCLQVWERGIDAR